MRLVFRERLDFQGRLGYRVKMALEDRSASLEAWGTQAQQGPKAIEVNRGRPVYQVTQVYRGLMAVWDLAVILETRGLLAQRVALARLD